MSTTTTDSSSIETEQAARIERLERVGDRYGLIIHSGEWARDEEVRVKNIGAGAMLAIAAAGWSVSQLAGPDSVWLVPTDGVEVGRYKRRLEVVGE